MRCGAGLSPVLMLSAGRDGRFAQTGTGVAIVYRGQASLNQTITIG